MKIVINKCFGGFGLSHAAMLRYAELKGLTLYPEKDGDFSDLVGPTYYTAPLEQRTPPLENWNRQPLEVRRAYNAKVRQETLYARDIPRNDLALVQTVEELGQKAAGRFAELAVVEIPDAVKWEIDEYDGVETIHEKHRSWS